MTYAVEQLTPGSYDVLLDGHLVASLVREVDRSEAVRGWLIELLDETPPPQRPAPFTAQSHAFETRAAALAWLGIRDAAEVADRPLGEQRVP
ncbi:hypothetical protein MKK88_02580 [Methylobacterium sp. E-005]|uniref:hypothetical protein n=1 Tax=Methylobacterium sp. E-005 TaxID=2836549 RepID=UPI001FB8EF8A|nr:hypothetical protein [Methylobacterium sp. E-005]MCJ2084880.1 hypothetical protein [Methylobacterium sp. E-005]